MLQHSALQAVSKQKTGSASTAFRCMSLPHCAARSERTRARCSSVQAKLCNDAYAETKRNFDIDAVPTKSLRHGDVQASLHLYAGVVDQATSREVVTLTRMMGISALSFTGMKKKARTMTSAAITICAHADLTLRGSPVVTVMTMMAILKTGGSLRRISIQRDRTMSIHASAFRA